MINEAYKAMLGGKSVIRELSEYATARGAEIGYENVFDYSLGNPSVPCPQSFTDEMIALYQRRNRSRCTDTRRRWALPRCARPLRKASTAASTWTIRPTTSSRPRVRPVRWPTHCAW